VAKSDNAQFEEKLKIKDGDHLPAEQIQSKFQRLHSYFRVQKHEATRVDCIMYGEVRNKNSGHKLQVKMEMEKR